jgi:hypothetical protein
VKNQFQNVPFQIQRLHRYAVGEVPARHTWAEGDDTKEAQELLTRLGGAVQVEFS